MNDKNFVGHSFGKQNDYVQKNKPTIYLYVLGWTFCEPFYVFYVVP